MGKNNLKYGAVCLIILGLSYSCAQFASPQGGPKDEDPPVIVEELSEPNYQIFFNKKVFELEFNEWVELRNPVKEVVISPPTRYPLKVTSKGKRIRVEFAEEELLRDSATYQINFGDAVRDFTAGNIYKNLVFVFSTGSEIDSLSVAGTVSDAVTGKPANDVLVCLYDKLNDSIISREQPFYFSKSDKSGRYKLSNIRSDSFLIFALKDENVNYYYDLPSEKVAFYKKPVELKDSSIINIDLLLFDEKDPARLVEYKQNEKGLIRILFKPMPDSLNFRFLGDTALYMFHEAVADSVYLWHTALDSDSTQFIVEYAESIDTINNKKARKSAKAIPLKLEKSVKASVSFHRGDTVFINFNKPLADIDLNKIRLLDSIDVVQIDTIFVKNKRLGLYADSLKHNYTYKLELDSSAITDVYKVENKDSISLMLKTYNPINFGKVVLNFINNSDTLYLWELKLGNNVLGSGVINDNSTRVFTKMSTGTYKLKLTEDANGDGKWTSGKVVLKRMPEQIKEISLDELKPGWDLDLDIEIKEIFYGTEVEQSN